jgi:long-chain acyl-CoA synthetase
LCVGQPNGIRGTEHSVEPRPPGAVLLTGATGFVGMELLARYVERSDRRVYALVRGADDAEAAGRLHETLHTLLGEADAHADRVVAVPGDICADQLGLDPERRERLAADVSEIVHSAASVSFSMPLPESREINVEGTRRMLEFAELCHERGGLRRFGYVSTAYVAGTHPGEFGEDQLDVGQDFRNPYERTKFEAERLVRDYRRKLPIQIFRPSIIVGEASSGWTATFNVLYTPLRAFARNALPALPARRSSPVDAVPVDYVADGVFELCRRPVEDEEPVYHLVAGRGATTIDRLVHMSARHFRRRRPPVVPPRLYQRLLHPLLVRRGDERRRRALRGLEVFFPYLRMRVRFDDARARSRLEPAGISAPPLERYFSRLVDFAERARWGKAAPTRAEAHGRCTPRGGRPPKTPSVTR